MNRPISLIALLAGVVFLGVGCVQHSQQQANYNHGELVPTEEQPRQIDKLLEAQEAAGAGLDATLHTVHFDGDMLNTLGQSKLDLMLKDEHACYPLVVYVELQKDDPMIKGRTEAVSLYLKDRGLSEGQFTVKVGPNTSYSSPAVDNVRQLRIINAGGGPTANIGGTAGQ